MNSISLALKWFILRKKAKLNIRYINNKNKNAMKLMNNDQLRAFHLVERVSSKCPECIYYDKFDGESETLLTQKRLLITLHNKAVSIDNHKGFHTEYLPEESFNLLMRIVDKNAHRFRRKLKYEVRLNIRAFMDSIDKDQDDAELQD